LKGVVELFLEDEREGCEIREEGKAENETDWSVMGQLNKSKAILMTALL